MEYVISILVVGFVIQLIFPTKPKYKVKEKYWLSDKQPVYGVYRLYFFGLIPLYVTSFDELKGAKKYIDKQQNYE